MDIDKPSRFWERLGGVHKDELNEFGLEHFKRHQALRYFTWRWQWSSIRSSEQFRFLLANTPRATWLRCALSPPQLSRSAWAGVPWSISDRWLYTFAVRLLWAYAEGHDDLGILRLPEPSIGGPFPVYWRGRLISQDLANCSLEASAIDRALSGRAPRSILEVGAGYGRTAYSLLTRYPDASYTIIDIEPASLISRWYLTQLFPDRDLRFLSPAEATSIPAGSVDLALSISSLQEMTLEQVGAYLTLLDSVASGGTVFLKQWSEWENPEDGITLSFDEYPIPARWRSTMREAAPVQTAFVQAAWQVPSAAPAQTTV